MSEFELGFLAKASEYGLPDLQATHMLKRALEYPGAQQMFKQLPAEAHDAQSVENLKAEDLQILSALMEQQKAHEEMQNLKKQLGI
jgi:hypothetical protein